MERGELMATPVERPTDEDVFAELHRHYLGGSDAYQLLNIPQYGKGCRRALAYEKLGVPRDYADDDPEDKAILERGKWLEPVIAEMYEQQTGRKVRLPATKGEPLYHPRFKFAGVHTDRIILSGSGGVQTPGDLEIKSRAEGPYWRVLREGPFPGDVLQIHWSCWITGHLWGALAVLGVFSNLPLKHFDIKADPELFAVFEREGGEFAELIWGAGKLPDPPFDAHDMRCKVCAWRYDCRGEQIDRDEAAALREMARKKKELVQIANPELAHILADVDLLNNEIAALKSSLKDKKAQALPLVEHEAILLKGYGVVYRLQWHGVEVDKDALAEDGLYEKYVFDKVGAFYLRHYPTKKPT